MLHKAPAAFGLVTFLMHEGIDRSRIRKHLLTFSFAAPTLALTTYILLVMHKGSDADLQGKVKILKLPSGFNQCLLLFLHLEATPSKKICSIVTGRYIPGNWYCHAFQCRNISICFNSARFARSDERWTWKWVF